MTLMDSWKIEFEESALDVIRDGSFPPDVREGVALGLIDHFSEEGARGFDFNLRCFSGQVPFMPDSAKGYAFEKAIGFLAGADARLLRRLVGSVGTPAKVREAAAKSLLDKKACETDAELVRKRSEFVKKPGTPRNKMQARAATIR